MLENTQYGFSKDKLPKAFCYPLKRSLLDAGLNGATAMDAVCSVRYLFGRGRGPATIDALFSPERSGAHASVSGKSLITVSAVPSAERKTCEDIFPLRKDYQSFVGGWQKVRTQEMSGGVPLTTYVWSFTTECSGTEKANADGQVNSICSPDSSRDSLKVGFSASTWSKLPLTPFCAEAHRRAMPVTAARSRI